MELRGGKKTAKDKMRKESPAEGPTERTRKSPAKKRKTVPEVVSPGEAADASSVPLRPPTVEGDTTADSSEEMAADTAAAEPGDDSDDEVTKSDEVGEDKDEEVEETEEESHSDGRNADAWAEKEAMKPVMYFPPEEYSKNIKVSTRCHILEVLETFNDLDLTQRERDWFEEHPQFRHIMHMPKSHHMVQPMWMLLVRTAEIERKKEAWFVVNGIPIRYGLREHALISGLDCRNYPLDWQRKGSSSFKNKYFTDPKKKDKKKMKMKKKILREDVRERLKKMGPDDNGDRLKMAVLYFLSSIVYCPTKTGASGKPVLDIFVRYVANLDLCKTFPWGRLSFHQMLESINSTMKHFDGVVSGDWTMPGFCLPLELLAMEAIPELKLSFREPVPPPHDDCPRMCNGKWVKCELRGWPLETVYEKLGKTKDIDSLLTASEEEKEILDSIMEMEDDVDVQDPIVESWAERLHNGFTVAFEDMMEEDVNGREKKRRKEQRQLVKLGNRLWRSWRARCILW